MRQARDPNKKLSTLSMAERYGLQKPEEPVAEAPKKTRAKSPKSSTTKSSKAKKS